MVDRGTEDASWERARRARTDASAQPASVLIAAGLSAQEVTRMKMNDMDSTKMKVDGTTLKGDLSDHKHRDERDAGKSKWLRSEVFKSSI